MKRNTFSEEQIVRILREPEQKKMSQKDLCKKHGISEQAFYRWKAKFGGMDVPDAKRLRQLEGENAKLKKMLAEKLLDIELLQELNRKKW